MVVAFLFSAATLAFFGAEVDPVLSMEIRLMSDLSDLVEESVSRLRLLLPLLTSSSTWLELMLVALVLILVALTCTAAGWLLEVALLVAVTVTEVEGVDAVVDVVGVEASSFAVDAAAGVGVAKRGLKRFPPLTKSDC